MAGARRSEVKFQVKEILGNLLHAMPQDRDLGKSVAWHFCHVLRLTSELDVLAQMGSAQAQGVGGMKQDRFCYQGIFSSFRVSICSVLHVSRV